MSNAPTIRLSIAGGSRRVAEALSYKNLPAPSILVSYFYINQFNRFRDRMCVRDWALDSGAFSAKNRRKPVKISLDGYIERCLKLLSEEDKPVEIFSLDDLDSPEQSIRNCEKMREAGVPAIPCYHQGESWEVLQEYSQKYEKIAIGGTVGKGRTGKDYDWIDQVFARVWPKRIHGFGFGSEKQVMTYPFDSVDSTGWEIMPCQFGHWFSMGEQKVSVRGSRQNLRVEVDAYLRLESKARARWKSTWGKINDECRREEKTN